MKESDIMGGATPTFLGLLGLGAMGGLGAWTLSERASKRE